MMKKKTLSVFAYSLTPKTKVLMPQHFETSYNFFCLFFLFSTL